MPTYDYQCDACGHAFEKFQSMTARPDKTCPACGARKLRRLIGTGAGIIFKGSGFHATDYRSKDYKEAVRKEKDTATKSSSDSSSSKSTGTSDTKSSKKAGSTPA